ncbi:unnamed protein product [Caenorhabditis angaria]|uniref:Uncharacterized protein n=1 Tax=Caenorhabditis angaria TaxID=860376 RepID=A0A9P1IAT9_9PELO|nr:unnamed protein product [Caenorhabditis angaria]
MRIPEGAPVPFWLSIRNRFPRLAKTARPTVGTVAVITTGIITCLAVCAVTVYPKYYNDYYKNAQKEERALLRLDREQLAGPQNAWRDPFEKK